VEVETITAAGVGPGWRVEVTGYDSGAYRFIYRYLNPGTMAVLRRGETAAGLMDPYALRGPAAATYLPMIWGRQSSQIHSAESPGATAQP
jgi:hypothetical protein